MAERLAALVSSWPHQRDRGYYIRKDGTEERLWDSGCHNQCRRCEIEKFLIGEAVQKP